MKFMRFLSMMFGSKSQNKRKENSDYPFACPPSDDTPCAPTTTSMQDILGCSKALAIHHSITEFTASNYHEILGSALGEVYVNDPRTRMQCNSLACVLSLHCGIASARSFLNVLHSNGFETGIYVTDSNRLAIDNGNLIFGTMDVYEVGRWCAQNGEMEFGWNPFDGPACMLWSFGYTGVAPDSPEVLEALEDYAERQFIIQQSEN